MKTVLSRTEGKNIITRTKKTPFIFSLLYYVFVLLEGVSEDSQSNVSLHTHTESQTFNSYLELHLFLTFLLLENESIIASDLTIRHRNSFWNSVNYVSDHEFPVSVITSTEFINMKRKNKYQNGPLNKTLLQLSLLFNKKKTGTDIRQTFNFSFLQLSM